VLGLAGFTGVWYLPVIVVLASLLYHERIAAREECFLEERFGDDFRRWAARVPAMIPTFAGYVPPAAGFRWKRVLGREFHALFVIGAAYFVLDVALHALAIGRLSLDPFWTAGVIISGAVFVVLTVVKKSTRWLRAD
jgi:hypothetical protein